MKKLTLTLFVILFGFIAKAQIVNVCGTDSVTLSVDNYVNGTIEWQESIDNISWANIPEVSGVTYKFLPTETKYYRAVVKTTDCCPLYSAISLVQLIPLAYAGADRTIGNISATLLGNIMPGATGEWTILSGTGGVLDDPTNPKALLTGVNKETYSLKWTLTNACGQSSDTVAITFDELKVKNNFIVVDNTDLILSDSTEMANGTFRVKFSDPTITPVDSVMLIGMREDMSFLWRVNSFMLQDSVYTFSTTQGSLDDLLLSGSLNLGDAINQALSKGSSKLKSAVVFPTRATLKDNINNKGVNLLYSKVINSENISSLKSATTSTNQDGCQISLPDMLVFSSPDGFSLSIKDSYIKIDPNFVVDRKIDFSPPFLHYLKFGVDNGEFEFNIKTVLQSTTSLVNFAPLKKTLFSYPIQLLVTIPGTLPIPCLFSIDIVAECQVGVTAAISLEQTNNYKMNVTALLEKTEEQEMSFKKEIVENSTNEAKLLLKGSLGCEFKIGPEISFRVFNFFGPYLNIPAKIKMDVCSSVNANPVNNNWQANGSIGIDGTIGVNGKAFGWTLLDFHKPLFNDAFKKTIKLPYKLEMLSGYNQSGTAGATLSKPISFRAVSSLGYGVPLVPVRFETGTGNGTVDQTMIYTDSEGKVSVNWTLGTNSINKLKASVLDCDNNDIENSPMYIYAKTATPTYDCNNSSLNIDMKTANGYLYPSVTGGAAPYTYSTNGTDYNSTVPQFNAAIAGNNSVYVKDKTQCVKTRAFTIKPTTLCTNSTLSLDALVQPNILTLKGISGKAPYQFAVDNAADFTATATYYKLSAGTHAVYVKDANGCTASKSITVAGTDTEASISASYPANASSYILASSVTFQWTAGNYATNQVYELYLKKGSDAYSLITSNLSSTSYTYATALLASTAYTWKVAVKTGDTVLDEGEFTFTTASGLSTTPAVPVLLTPADGSTYSVPYVTLSWQAQSGDFVYDVYLDAKNATNLLATNVTGNSITFGQPSNNQLYYWKVKIKNRVTGESKISAIQSFTLTSTSKYGTIADIDGNIYHTITIGAQTWMVENLKTTHYNDGTAIPNVTDGTAWAGLTTPAYCWYNNDATYKNPYGALYNWYTVNTGKLAPAGWHVATDAEWTTLTTFLGGESVAGGKLKESGTTHWSSPNTAANDETGFTALPGGYRNYYNGAFYLIGNYGYWWSATEYDTNYAWYRNMYYSYGYVYRYYLNKPYGFSVRCVRDY